MTERDKRLKISERWAVTYFSMWTGQTLSMIGSSVARFAIIWWITEQTGSAVTLTTLALFAFIPQIFVGPIAGALVDRWSRKGVMAVSDSLSALAAAVLAYLFWIDGLAIWHIYIITFVSALGGTFHAAAMMASTSLMVPENHLARVQGINQAVQGLLIVAGPPLGALALAFMPLHFIMGIDVVTAIFAVAPLLFIRIPQPSVLQSASGDTVPKSSVMQDVRSGVAYIWQWTGLLFIILFGVILNFIINPVMTLLPILVTEHFNGGAPQLAWIEAAFGVGLLGGGILLGVWGGFQKKTLMLPIGLIGMALGGFAIGFAPSSAFWMACGGMLIFGTVNSLLNGSLMALLQSIVEPEMQGRVFTVLGSSVQAAVPIGLLLAGPIVDAIGISAWFVIASVVMLAIGLIVPLVPQVMNLEDSSPNESSKQLADKHHNVEPLPLDAMNTMAVEA
ncbi:MAG: MFS transporter [Chloroflexota bacterium]